MATTEMISSYPTWVKVRWGATETFTAADALFDDVLAMRSEGTTGTAPTWSGPASSSSYVTAVNAAISELLGINVTTLWDSMINKYNLISFVGGKHQERFTEYETYEDAAGNFIVNRELANTNVLVHPISDKGTELYNKLLLKETDLLDDIASQLGIVNGAVKDGLVDVYDKAFQQHLNKGTLWSSFCYNWILDQYEKVIGANREYTNKVVLELRDKSLDRIARLIEVSGQTHGQGKQLGLTHDKLFGELRQGQADRAGKILELASASFEKATLAEHEVASKIVQTTLQVEELQSKMKATVSEMTFQMDMEIAKASYSSLITTKKWSLDLSKYSMEAMAALQGASPLSKSSSESGWSAMSSTEKALSIASVGTSMASGISSILKAIG